ncbi:MAG: hypothetical protein Q7T81_09500 [Pseudolabrys sp.]|nr:hypothetical protein [Pseudolabrys sp.]
MNTKKTMLLVLVLIVLFALAPIISLLTAIGIANIGGCQLDEGNVHACVLLGMDFGTLLYAMGVMGWMALMTVPLAGMALGVWAVAALVLYIRARRAV